MGPKRRRGWVPRVRGREGRVEEWGQGCRAPVPGHILSNIFINDPERRE